MTRTLRQWLPIAALAFLAGVAAACAQTPPPDAAPDATPRVGPSTPLVVIDAAGRGFAHLRAAPDPRSLGLNDIATGTSGIIPTGQTMLYGDTWWIEVKGGGGSGWVNARLVAYAPHGKPVQATINIDALQPVGDFSVEGVAYREAAATSFEECARRCMVDPKCTGIGYSHAPPYCSQFDHRLALLQHGNFTVAMKAQPEPDGGWSSAVKSRYTRLVDHGFLSVPKHLLLAHSREECTALCDADATCAAYAYQKDRLLCELHDNSDRPAAKAQSEAGVRIAASVSVMTAPARDADDDKAVADLLDDALLGAVIVTGFDRPEIKSTGRLRIVRRTTVARAMALGASSPAVLTGDVDNLAALIDGGEPSVLRLVYYAGPMAAPVVVARVAADTPTSAAAKALRMQRDLDEIAKIADIRVDPLALLKLMRR